MEALWRQTYLGEVGKWGGAPFATPFEGQVRGAARPARLGRPGQRPLRVCIGLRADRLTEAGTLEQQDMADGRPGRQV